MGGEVTAAVLKTLTGVTAVNAAELSKAKAMLKNIVARQLDSAQEASADLGKQLLLTGRYASAEEWARAIDGVTDAQVVSAAKRVVSSKVTVAAVGDTHAVPSLASVEAMLK